MGSSSGSNMTHKVHPKIFRIQKIEDWSSRWFTKKNFTDYLKEDFLIREFFKENFPDVGIASISIERFPGEIKVLVETSRPGLLIGRGGEGIEKIKKNLEEKVLKRKEKTLKLEIIEVRYPWTKANLVAQWMVKQIEKRVPYRRVLKQVLQQVMANKEIKGAKLEVAGRLDGVEIARREWLKKGQLPLQTIRADIDYAKGSAECPYGTVGIKVWLYKGEKI